MEEIQTHKLKIFGWAILLIAASALYFWGAMQQANLVNLDMTSTDQSAYMDYARNMHETNFQFIGGRNRMPLYPALMSLFYAEGMTYDTFFEIGKNVGIVIGYVGLIGIFFILNQVGRFLDVITSVLITAFTVFAYKAPYFQAEILFYLISFSLFYLLILFLKKPSLKLAVFIGVVAGLGHLTKASVLPAIALTVALVALRSTLQFYLNWKSTKRERQNPLHFPWQEIGNTIVVVCVFLLVIFPYIQTSKERFGKYFYNVNSTFYIWYDSWAEATQGTKAHGDRIGWPTMPEEEIPSMQKYIREHSTREIVQRVVSGYQVMWQKVSSSYGYAPFLIIYALFATLFLFQNRTRFTAEHFWLMLFVMGYFLGYSLLFAWYIPIASGNRFVLSLFLPAMLVFVWLISFAQNNSLKLNLLGWKLSFGVVSPLLLVLLTLYLITVYPTQIMTMYGGS